MKTLNVEGGEIAIKNKNGDLAIIPKDKVHLVEALIKKGDHAKVDAFVSMLPKMATTAGDGTVHPNVPKKGTAAYNLHMQDKYGPKVKHKEIYMELYDKKLPATQISARKSIYDDANDVSMPAGDLRAKHMEVARKQQAWERRKSEDIVPDASPLKIPSGNPLENYSFDPAERERQQEDEYLKIPHHLRDDSDNKDIAAWENKRGNKAAREMWDLEDEYNQLPETLITSDNPETSWREQIEGRTDIEDKELLYASLMNEGADQFTNTFEGGERGAYDGYGDFGLDRFGERIQEFEDRGLMPKDGMKQRLLYSKHNNEKGEDVVSADFTNLKDVVTAKNAFLKSGKQSIDRKVKELGIGSLSQNAKDYFTVLAYNFGEGGARTMLQKYHDNGLLKDDKFMEDDSYDGYRQPHTYAKGRVQAMNMLRGEGTMNPKQKVAMKNEKKKLTLLESHPDYLTQK